jgi:hypothetical protein
MDCCEHDNEMSGSIIGNLNSGVTLFLKDSVAWSYI